MDVLTTEHKNLGSNPTINDRAVTVCSAGEYLWLDMLRAADES